MDEEEKKEPEIMETKETIQKEKPTSNNGLGIAGLILGIMGIVLSFIPIVNFLSYILGILALIFGIIALVKSSKKIMGIIALILGILSFILPFLINAYAVKKTTDFLGDALKKTIIDSSEEFIKPDETPTDSNEIVEPSKTPTDSNEVRISGETFIFNNFEITISKDYTFDVVKKEGPYYGTEAIVLPVTLKNLKDESHYFSYSDYKVSGSKGFRVDSLCDFFDNNIDYLGDFRAKESRNTNFYFTYDGNGRYSIDFGYLSIEKTYEFDVTK